MSNIHGLSSKRTEKKADEEEYSQGAAGQSGTAVWRPTASAARGPSGAAADPFADILAQARSNSSGGAPPGASDRNVGLITLYQNGFIIGNGEFRDIKDPKNKGVLDQLKKGEVPDELEAICRKEWGDNTDAVSVNLVDKTQETFTPPPPKFSFATSQGQSLGGSSSSAAATAASFAEAVPRQLTVDASQPTTSLQLVLADRKRVKLTANQTATVLEVYQHVMSLTGLSGFELVAGFPPKPLASPGVTLKDAGLLNGSITQRGGA